MAVASVETLEWGVSTGTPATSSSWTPSADDLIFVLVGGEELNKPDPLTVSGNGLTWVQVGSMVSEPQGEVTLSVFRGMSASPSAGAITLTMTGNTDRVAALAIRISGADTSGSDGEGAIGATATNYPTSDNNDMKVDITTGNDDSVIFAFATHRRRSEKVLLTLNNGETADRINYYKDDKNDAPTCSIFHKAADTAGAYTMLADGSLSNNDEWNIMAIEVKAAPSGGQNYTVGLSGSVSMSSILTTVLTASTANISLPIRDDTFTLPDSNSNVLTLPIRDSSLTLGEPTP